jgi:hypothetical protein
MNDDFRTLYVLVASTLFTVIGLATTFAVTTHAAALFS